MRPTSRAHAFALALVLGVLAPALTGCVDDPNCGICDPRNLILETVAGQNYAGRKVQLLSPACEGPACPRPLSTGTYFIDTIGPCEQTEDARTSTRGAAEYCKLAPIVTAFGVEFVFNNLLEASSVELVRRRPDNPNLFEVYDWKTQVLEIQGPTTRYRGDYDLGARDVPDQITRRVNLACIENLAARGIEYGHAEHDDPASDPCNRFDPDANRPVKMLAEGTLTAARGAWEERAVAAGAGNSCASPDLGPDTCCSQCDRILGVGVAKYGLTQGAPPDAPDYDAVRPLLARPGAGAIGCDPTTPGDKYVECAGFVPWVDRSQEIRRYDYAWCPPGLPCEQPPQGHRLPRYDRIRETHPGLRPADAQQRNAACTASAQCRDEQLHDLPGAECIGRDASGNACDPATTPGCTDGRCEAPWFVACRANPDTTGPQGYCVDTRFSDAGAPACYRAPAGFEVCDPETGRCRDARADTKLAVCDVNEDGRYDAVECCVAGGEENCDPAYQPGGLEPVARYERNRDLPEATRDCVCPPERQPMASGCEEYAAVCRGREGEYAVKFVAKRGGIIYDPAIKGLQWRPADQGSVPRAAAEACAEERRLIAARTVEDGWRAHDPADTQAENYEDYDRAMCSGSRYRIVFAEPPGPGDAPREHVRDKVGNTLQGKATYTFETPEFHVVPGSGFPTDNLRIGACDDFAIRFSNKYDLGPENLTKLQIVEVVEYGSTVGSADACEYFIELDGGPGPERVRPVAGGPNCVPSSDDVADACAPPCLQVDVAGHEIGEVAVRIEAAEFGQVLQTGQRYYLVVPGLADPAERVDEGAYAAAFWDACGMPLVLGGYRGDVPDYVYAFDIDEPTCREDRDRDNVPFSCDNARDFFNPDQGDIDRDGVGDVIDLCPTVVTPPTNSGDSDDDGVGNECDTCRQPTDQYNRHAAAAGVPAKMMVRNIPAQTDTDGDGIGDVCDNCPTVANCEGYGPGDPYRIGDPIAYDDASVCQRDDDLDMVGDACFGLDGPDAAGPVGYLDDDDFDQDGIANFDDACPRQPATSGPCDTDADCPTGSACERVMPSDAFGVCDHVDTDGDGVGDICDSCPSVPNPMQVVEGGMQVEDADGDFVGDSCETAPECETRSDARPFSFYPVSSSGMCCVTALAQTSDALVNRITRKRIEDPDGLPVTLDCIEDEDGDGMRDAACRRLPETVARTGGIVSLPDGCDDALAAAGMSEADNRLLTPADFGGDLVALWDAMCFLPQFDQDFDGVGDPCDLCKFDFDPANEAFIDDNGKLWPGDGKFCNGVYSVQMRDCGDDEPPGGTSGGEETDGSGSSGSGTGTDG